MKSNTGTGTTATAEPARPYRGRFAPSPTGRLHRGSLVAAVASFLDARSQSGTWLVRIEDLDSARNLRGMEEEILAALELHCLVPDEPVIRQSDRLERYTAALASLQHAGLVYRCTCSRSETGGSCSGRCRDQGGKGARPGPAAWRLRMNPDEIVRFHDRMLGTLEFRCGDLGDPVVFRRDGVPAYQLAVVVDDAAQGITDVVRGADLVASTPWQIQLGAALGLPTPHYGHVPLVVETDGSKLSKSRQSLPLNRHDPGKTLLESLRLLRQDPPTKLEGEVPSAILDWAIGHWDSTRLQGLQKVALPL